MDYKWSFDKAKRYDEEMNKGVNGLLWPTLISGTLIKRYKRFLADVKLGNGETVIAHCPNSGSMATCAESGRPVYLSYHNDPKRKLKYTWELIEMPSSLVGVNTNVPNRLVKLSIEKGLVKELIGYETIQAEVKSGKASRLDLMLTKKKGDEQCFVEVKNCTLVNNSVAYFPDAVTSRGLKHLVELQRLVSEGTRAVMFFFVQRMDATLFKPADHIDPAYGKELRQALKNGVEILIYDVCIDLKKIVLNHTIPFRA